MKSHLLKKKKTPPDSWVTKGGDKQSRASTNWLRDFNDSRLIRLVDESLRNNPSLRARSERLIAAQASVVKARSSRIPSLSSSAAKTRTRRNREVTGDERDYTFSQRIRFTSSWEIDLWGRLRNLDQAARSNYSATEANYYGARLSLAVSTASLWYQLIRDENQFFLAKETLEGYRKVEKIIERNYKAGTARSLDLQLSRNNVYRAERTLRSRIQRRDDSVRSLEVLLGRYPSKQLLGARDLPNIRRGVPVGLPADLIERRPDLIAAKKEIEESFYRALAAKKNLLPSLSLTGSSGTSPASLTHLLDPGFLVSSISASISQSLFQGGSRVADVRAALARNRATIEDFSDTALEAFREVESALASEKSLEEQEYFLTKELKQASLAEKQAERDYTEGWEELISSICSNHKEGPLMRGAHLLI